MTGALIVTVVFLLLINFFLSALVIAQNRAAVTQAEEWSKLLKENTETWKAMHDRALEKGKELAAAVNQILDGPK